MRPYGATVPHRLAWHFEKARGLGERRTHEERHMNEGAKDTFGTAAARRVPRIAVLVPCYNEAVTIAKVVDLSLIHI